MRSVPPIDPAILRRIFDDEPEAITPWEQPKEITMIIKLASIAALALATPASAPAGHPASLVRLVEPCARKVMASIDARSRKPMDDYIDGLLADAPHKQAEIIACGAYLMGAEDERQGRFAAFDAIVAER